MLPDGHRRLELVDQRAARVERHAPVASRYRDHNRDVADGQVANPVHGGDRMQIESFGDLHGNLVQLICGGRVRRIGQLADGYAVVVVTDSADEDGDATRRRVRDSSVDLIDGQSPVSQFSEPHDVHPATLHRPAASAAVRRLGRRARLGLHRSVITTPLANLADDRRCADDGHGSASRRDPRVLLLQPAPGDSMVTSALLEQHLKGLLVGDGRLPARVSERAAVDDPRVHHIVQV